VSGGAYGPDDFAKDIPVSRETRQALETYVALLTERNATMNLVARSGLEDVWRRHLLDSAQLSRLLPESSADRPLRIADLGSGAGFPGMVLAILGAGEIHLVESIGKKARFLLEAAAATARVVQVHADRAENLEPLMADLVTARALAPLPKLLPWVARHLGPGGRALLLKGRSLTEELEAARPNWRMDYRIHPSLSDPEGQILEIGALRRNAQVRGHSISPSRRRKGQRL